MTLTLNEIENLARGELAKHGVPSSNFTLEKGKREVRLRLVSKNGDIRTLSLRAYAGEIGCGLRLAEIIDRAVNFFGEG